MGKYIIKRTSNDHWLFNLLTENDQVILTSKLFPTIEACKNGIDLAKENALIPSRYEPLMTSVMST